jgi:hypothetical protein
VTFTHSADCHDPVCPEMHESPPGPGVSVLQEVLRVTSHISERDVRAKYIVTDLGLRGWAIQPQQAPGIDAELLGRAIREHRQAEFDPHAVISMTHLCFDDCAENIAARYDELASR